MIELKLGIGPDHEGETVSRDVAENAIDILADAWESLQDGMTFTVDYGIDVASDTVYEKVKFRIDSRFKLAGDRYIAGSGFMVNLDQAFKLMMEKSK